MDRTTISMVDEFPRAYGLQRCRECNNLFVANSNNFSNFKDKNDNERPRPTCVKCTKQRKKDREMEDLMQAVFGNAR